MCKQKKWFEGDPLWNSTDEELIQLAGKELETLKIADRKDILEGCVVRQIKAYPFYDLNYSHNISVIRTELEQRFPTLHLAGRNGMHKYNNQDHAMMTARLCAENIISGKKQFDPWQVNQDAQYLEEW